MIGFVSLHTKKPSYQLEHEVAYEGYRRVPIEFDRVALGETITVTFPIVEKDSPDEVTHVAIGAVENGQGEIFMSIPSLPYIKLQTTPERLDPAWWVAQGVAPENAAAHVQAHGHVAPRICICNTNTVTLPVSINPIARVAHQLIFAGLMTAEELHPKLYEAINKALEDAGVPIIPVTRQGAAAMTGTLQSIMGEIAA